jgi:CYTH domain-containing protein
VDNFLPPYYIDNYIALKFYDKIFFIYKLTRIYLYNRKVLVGIEIERKFLLKNDQWRKLGEGLLYRQGYLSTDIERTVRVRTIGNMGFLTIKGKTKNATRDEFEYEIPLNDAEVWEIDEFWGENEGLIIAEVELEDNSKDIYLPDWIGNEVTENPAYYNANLVKNPYSTW